MKPFTAKALAVFLTGMALFQVLVIWNAREELRKGYSDFAIFYTGGRILSEGLGQQLYDETTQFRIQRQFARNVSIRQGPLPYNHPPFEALLYVPLTFLPYFAAYVVWFAINLGILFVLPVLLRRQVAGLRRAPAWLWLIGSLAFFPAFVALLQGQDSILLLLLIVLAYGSLKRRADFIAGCWLGLGLFRFQMVLPLVLILVLQKRWKVLLGLGGAALALAGVSVALVGWNTAIHYPAYMWQVESNLARGAIVPANMPNLRGFLETLLGAHVSRAGAVVLLALPTIILLAFASAKWKPASTGALFDLGFSLAVIASVLVGYHTHAHDLTVLYLPLVLTAYHWQMSKRGWSLGALPLLLPPFLLLLGPVDLAWQAHGWLNLLALAWLFWGWGISREITRLESAALHPMDAV